MLLVVYISCYEFSIIIYEVPKIIVMITVDCKLDTHIVIMKIIFMTFFIDVTVCIINISYIITLVLFILRILTNLIKLNRQHFNYFFLKSFKRILLYKIQFFPRQFCPLYFLIKLDFSECLRAGQSFPMTLRSSLNRTHDVRYFVKAASP